MSDMNRRLNGLEKVWPPPVPRAHREPVRFDWNLLTEEEHHDAAGLQAAMLAVDVPPGLDRRSDVRARLDALSDDQLERLSVLTEKVHRLTEETTP